MKNFINKIATNDVVVRATKTFIQAFIAVYATTSEPLSRNVFVAAVAAGVSAVWNTIRKA